MKNRIEQIIKHKNLTSVKFAEAIGVQASSISHVVSGRSKPSFEFLEKIKNRYPELNMNWLISGEGEMFSIGDSDENQNEKINFEEEDAPIYHRKTNSQQQKKSVFTQTYTNDGTKTIERVVVFFTDKTFNEYKPS